MHKLKSQRSGRRNNDERIRELVSLLGSLSHTGDRVTISAISSRLGLSADEAQRMMDLICQASGEEIGGLLISSNEDETEYTLQYPGIHGQPIRLTMAETVALIHALDYAGIDEADPLRRHLQDAFYSIGVDQEDVRQALGVVSSERGPLYLCAQALAEHRALHFAYLGIKDAEPRPRNARIISLTTSNDKWYALSYDLDNDEERNFRVDRMSDVTLGDVTVIPESTSHYDVRQVNISFFDKSYYTAFEWPGLKVTHEDDMMIRGKIPYFGKDSTWLVRRICAGNGCIIVDDEGIMSLSRKYARSMLRQHDTTSVQ